MMPTFVVERDLEGAGWLSAEQLQGIAHRACEVLGDMEDKVTWVESYVTEDKFYCVYIAPDVAAVQEHAMRGDLPISRVAEVFRKFGPEADA
jgi:hypothetical protein